MKRFGLFACAFLACNLMTGCSNDTYEGLVQQTIQNMRTATTNMSTITAEVKKATEGAKAGKKFDLTAAMKAADKLKETGAETVAIKQRIDVVKARITPEEKTEYAANHQADLNDAFSKLLAEKLALRKALADAENADGTAKRKVDDLRKRIEEAESPFEAHAR
jgi:predicted  nucleic acid-binding Zn-ribbon protein